MGNLRQSGIKHRRRSIGQKSSAKTVVERAALPLLVEQKALGTSSCIPNLQSLRGSVYDRHCPAGASVMVSSPGCRRPDNYGRRCLISTRSVQRTKKERGITPGPRWVVSQFQQPGSAASTRLCFIAPSRAPGVGCETGRLPPNAATGLSGVTNVKNGGALCEKRSSTNAVCARCSEHVLHDAGTPLTNPSVETREDHGSRLQLHVNSARKEMKAIYQHACCLGPWRLPSASPKLVRSRSCVRRQASRRRRRHGAPRHPTAGNRQLQQAHQLTASASERRAAAVTRSRSHMVFYRPFLAPRTLLARQSAVSDATPLHPPPWLRI